MTFPRLCLVRQKFPDRRIPDVAAEVRQQLAQSGFAARLKPGARVAIGVGSRGIHNIATIVRSVVRLLERRRACSRSCFPAMGSHGAATAEGPGRRAGALRHHRSRPWAARWSASSTWSRSARRADGIEAFMDRNGLREPTA